MIYYLNLNLSIKYDLYIICKYYLKFWWIKFWKISRRIIVISKIFIIKCCNIYNINYIYIYILVYICPSSLMVEQ